MQDNSSEQETTNHSVQNQNIDDININSRHIMPVPEHYLCLRHVIPVPEIYLCYPEYGMSIKNIPNMTENKTKKQTTHSQPLVNTANSSNNKVVTKSNMSIFTQLADPFEEIPRPCEPKLVPLKIF
jgi:hypothetical protein